MGRVDNEHTSRVAAVRAGRPRKRKLAVWAAAGAALLSLASPLNLRAVDAAVSAPLTGTFTETFNPVGFEFRGGFTFITLANTGQFEGTLSGPTQESGNAIVYPDGTVVVVAAGVCQCTFAGRSGTVAFRVRLTVTQNPEFIRGQVTFTGESGGLRGLAGSGRFEGASNVVTLSGQLVLP